MIDFDNAKAKASFINDKLIGRRMSITQETIENGEERVADRCPVALGIREITNEGFIMVSRHGISFGMFKQDVGGITIHVNVPHELSDWIADFDHYRDVEPLELMFDKHEKRSYNDYNDVVLKIVDGG